LLRRGEGATKRKGEGGNWFEETIQRKVGNGSNTYFWTDTWVESVPLRGRFVRLFYLSANKDLTVVEMFCLGWGERGQAWLWRRILFAWEEEVV
jgi:hypothetical protein